MIFATPKYKGYEFFYTNGTSHTKGGGLEEPAIRPGWNAIEKYKAKYNVSWNKRDEVNWPTRLSQKLGIKVYNEAIDGGGTFRAIRMAYNFIEKYKSDIGKFFIILELAGNNRLDAFYTPNNSYYIVSTAESKLRWATPNYFPPRKEDENEQDDFIQYVDKHIDWNNINSLFYSTLAGFYSYCKIRGIPIKILNRIDNEYYRPTFVDNDLVSTDRDLDIHSYCVYNECLIENEIDINDTHPGYFGHIKYADFLYDWLEKNLENR